MKKLALILIFTTVSILVRAAKASPIPFNSLQSDGSVITVMLHGDENMNWYTTIDGVLICRQANNFYVACVDADGNLSPTPYLAHNQQERTENELVAIDAQERDKTLVVSDTSKSSIMREPLEEATNPAYFPNQGNPTAIVILVNYSDVEFTVSDPATVFNQYLNGTEQTEYGCGESLNYGSVKQYFEDMSDGQFSPIFDVVGPVTLSNEMVYYGANSGSTTDVNCAAMVTEACELASTLIDFSDSKYDSNEDGDIDLVYVIYAGYGESNGADESTIWPKSGIGTFGTYSGKNVRRYGVNNELNATPNVTSGLFSSPKINGVGLFCHEFSHCLGLPDLYPTVSSAMVDNQEMEYWSIMDGGEYVYYGYYPTAYTAWERETLGWSTLSTLQSDGSVTLGSNSDGTGEAIKMINDNDETEYFVLENIQNNGWNKYLPGHGLLVYHVDWPTTTVSYNQRPNNTAGKPAMAVVPADSILISSYNSDYTTSQYKNSHYGDPFPGTSEVVQLTYEQLLPNYTWYNDGPEVYKALTDITEDEDAGTVTFNYISDTTSSIYIPINTKIADDKVFSIEGIYLGENASNLKQGIYIINGKKKIIF